MTEYSTENPKCNHPVSRLFAWHVEDPNNPKNRILCVACCDCGEVIRGAANQPEPKETQP